MSSVVINETTVDYDPWCLIRKFEVNVKSIEYPKSGLYSK